MPTAAACTTTTMPKANQQQQKQYSSIITAAACTPETINTHLARVHSAAAANEVDHADGLVGAAEDGRVSTVAAGGVPHAAVALYSSK